MRIDTNQYIITPLFILLILSGIAGLAVSLYLLKQHRKPGAIYLVLMQVATAAWVIFYGLEYSATSFNTKHFWSKLTYFGIVFAPLLLYFFSFYLASKQNKLPTTLKVILISIALFFLASVATNEFHHMHWKTNSFDLPTNTVQYDYGILFWFVFCITQKINPHLLNPWSMPFCSRPVFGFYYCCMI